LKAFKIYPLILILVVYGYSQTQTVIGPGLSGQDLWDFVNTNYKTTSTLGYTNARDTLYSVIDLHNDSLLTCVYTGFTIALDPSLDPSTDAYQKGINCEHTWPQSMGADVEPQKSDMHHLFPCKANVNSSRGNDPYAEIPDVNTDRWFRLDLDLTTIPTEYIDEYAEKENDAPQSFEPREDHKGDAARAMFYFNAIYNDVADTNFWNVQKDVLLQWHYYDPVDDWEYNRSNHIAHYQDNIANPFVLDSTLAKRIWFTNPVIDWPLESDSMNLAILVVDYQDYNFEGGHFSIHAPCQSCTEDSLPFNVILNDPIDFGDITFLYNYTLDTLFFATIIWMGSGHILYPENFLHPDSFAVLTDSINEPNAFEYFHYAMLWDPVEFQARVDTAWQVVNKLDITGQMSINDYYVGAYFYPPSLGLFDPDPAKWIFFLYQDLTRGTVSTTDEKTIPKGYKLYQNHPNPFNPTTTIQYNLPERADVQITIYDLLGRKVTTLVSETQDAGYKSVQWNATNSNGQQVSTGVYFYQIKADGFVETRKMVLLR